MAVQLLLHCGLEVAVAVAVGVAVLQTQFELSEHELFLQNPVEDPDSLEQYRLPGQSLSTLQMLLHSDTGVAVDVGVEVGVFVGVDVGVVVGVGLLTLKVNDKEQAGLAACGLLDGTFGATAVSFV